jgi:hypothetical protein
MTVLRTTNEKQSVSLIKDVVDKRGAAAI